MAFSLTRLRVSQRRYLAERFSAGKAADPAAQDAPIRSLWPLVPLQETPKHAALARTGIRGGLCR